MRIESAVLLGILSGTVLAAACSGSEQCHVFTDAAGGVHIECGDESAVIPAPPSCFADLPDLDGSGTVDENDCTLVGVGASWRSYCQADPTRWKTEEACRSLVYTEVDGMIAAVAMTPSGDP